MKPAPGDEPELFSDDEAAQMLKAAIGAAPDGQTREDLQRVFDWATEARINATMLRFVLDGRAGMFVRHKDGELTMRILGQP